MNNPCPKISFGIIVLNGEPFTRYCIRSLYSHAYEIIVSEGACYGSRHIASKDGHSIDGTLDTLAEIKKNEDPDNKIIIVTAESEGHPDGFWPGEKHEQSQAYSKRATGDYLWQVDIDEFYKSSDIDKIMSFLKIHPEITAVSFKQLQFWGGFEFLVDSWLLKRGADEFHRLFKWGKGYQYKTHRPPTIIDDSGKDTRTLKWINSKRTKKMGIFLYHYSFVFPKQVFEKASYYKNAEWSQRKKADWWAEEVFMKLSDPFSVFSVYWDVSWIRRFNGDHPEQIRSMINDIIDGRLRIRTRHIDDIEKLLKDPVYKLRVILYTMLNPFDKFFQRYWKAIVRNYRKIRYANSTY